MYLPSYRPQQLSLGPLEQEILRIIWELETVTVKDVHDRILSDPDRELAYASVTTVLNRLTQKGWLVCNTQNRSFTWQALISESQATAWLAYERLHNFLEIGHPDIVAAFADSLDQASAEQLTAIAQRIQAIRQQRGQ
jgi:predicted transcriptional regulator